MAKHKPTRRPIRTDAERQQILALHAQGIGRNDIARETGLSGTFVSMTVKNAGGSFARGAEVIAATQAKQIDNKARRAAIIQDLYTIAQDTTARIKDHQNYKTLIKGQGGKDIIEVLDFIPAGERRNELTSVGISLDKALNLEKVDADEGVTRAESMLDKLTADLTEELRGDVKNAARDAALGNVEETDEDPSDL